ncbi:MAG: MATE family efflux transporter [Oscillospiraceae bacterium]|nr:MATE family efflux transporter [Oscillospiraceae bacterium]
MEKEHLQGNLTQGPILQVLIRLALPIMASAFLSTAYSITDMAWIGMLGSKAVAGVGVGGMYGWLSSGVAALPRMGGQVRVAQALGRGDRKTAEVYAAASLQMVTVMGLLYGAVCMIFTEQLVGFFQVQDPVTVRYAEEYLWIACGLIVFQFVGYTLTGLYTAQGDSKTPLKANFIGLILNMILDPILILGVGPFPRMEIVGAAVATVFAQIVTCAILVHGVVRCKRGCNILQTMPIGKLQEGYVYKAIASIGIPTSLQSMLYCGISMVLTRMVSGFGDAAIAAQRVGGQIESVSWNTADGFAAAMNAFAAQNYGAGDMERIKKGYRISFITMAVWGLFILLVFVFLPVQLSSIFFHEAHVIPVMVDYFIIVGFSEPFMCVELMAIGAISGLGNTKLCSTISIVFTALRIPLAMILGATSLGLNGIWWALTVTSMAKGIVLHFAFYRQCRISEAETAVSRYE